MVNFFKRLFGKDEPEKKQIVKEEKTPGTQQIDGHDYIDLGLPSGVVWSPCNLGANKPEEHGLYLQWGNAVLPQVLKPDYSQWNLPHSNNGSLTKYNTNSQCGFVDNRVVLDDPDDASSINWNDFVESAVDADGLDVAGSINADLSTLDTSTPGDYSVKLTVTDFAGNTADTDVTVTVAAAE